MRGLVWMITAEVGCGGVSEQTHTTESVTVILKPHICQTFLSI